MGEAGITFEAVWKKFQRGERHDSLRDLIPALARQPFARAVELRDQEFWAVRDVSFEVRPGEALGIIGPNGAGKSTILKLLTRILAPTRGRCEIRGRAGALIELAAGFHPDLTGRENVFLQGAIMGMRQADIARQFDRIVDFAGVAEFIDTPVKRYSSGMNARLGFAIAAHLDPEVLIIDEVLSVGDAAYQEQCITRMRELARGGVPLVFVSHNLPAVVELCTSALLLARGGALFQGTTEDAVREYRQASWTRQLAATENSTGAPIRITGVELLDADGQLSTVVRTGDEIRIHITYIATRAIERPQFAVDIIRDDGTYCTGINTRLDRWDTGWVQGTGTIELRISRLMLLRGAYLLSVGIHDTASAVVYDIHHRTYPFSVASDRRDLGTVCLDHSWSYSVVSGGPPVATEVIR
jgi:homopolymeric O-antigen transport system ATP-binding protein